ncbi:MAG: putative major facilitator superfamily transporter [Acidimicrobiaceae bacterium]|nr:putative major facilitator superfamily transporter [Acidimicrobiaceae bacterium]
MPSLPSLVRTGTSRRTRATHPALFVQDTRWSPAVWALLVVLCGALFLDALDVSMVGVALPSIGRDLRLAPGQLQWIVSGYVLGYGGLLLLGGRAADLIGRRPVFLAAVTVFGVASVVSALLSNDTALIALRFLKGASAACTVPAGLSIITTTFAEGPARSRAFSIYTVCGASGFSMGLVFGGLLTELSWRATFLLPGPVALALVLIGIRVIPRGTRQAARLSHFDLPGAISSTASLLLLVYAVVEAPTRGWGSAWTLGMLAGSALLMAAFVAIERRHPRPLLRLGILRSASILHANLGAAVMFGGYVAFQFVVTLYLQDALGWSPITMALGFLPAGLIVIASAPRMGQVLERFDTAVLILAGLVSLLAGYALFLRVNPSLSYWELLLPTMLLIGLGFALCFPSVNAQATAGVADHEQGLASGLVNTSIQIGGAVVLAVVSALIGRGSHGTIRHGQLLPGMTTAIAVISALSAVGIALTLVALVAKRRSAGAAQIAEPPDGSSELGFDDEAERGELAS